MAPARLVPNIAIEAINVQSERAVARALLDGLDDTWLILHSYPWLRPERGYKTYLEEGETDFVLLHPQFGMLVLEVKGGPVQYDAGRREWSRGGRYLKDPIEQASRNMHYLVDCIRKCPTFQGKMPMGFGYAVVFPDVEPSGPPPPGADPAIILGTSALADMGNRIRRAMTTWGTKPVDAQTFDIVKQIILPEFSLAPLLSSRFAADEQELVKLTDYQRQALSGLYSHPRVLVEGTAGSGKTMLAMHRATSFAKQGKRTLFLCFNRNLALHLHRRNQEKNLTVRHFHAMAAESCKKAKVPFQPPGEGAAAWWHDTAPDLMESAINVTDERFDAVVVDEAQDFHKNWWVPIEALVDDAPFYIFFDRAQNLYGTEPSFPHLPVKYELPVNCRNTRQIAANCSKIIGVDIPVIDSAPPGLATTIKIYKSKHECLQLVDSSLKQLLGPGKLKPSQVAILSPYRRDQSSVTSLPPSVLTDDFEAWARGDAVLFSTIKGFKGLEADAVIIADLEPAMERMLSEVYVGASRARHLLVILTSSPNIAEQTRAPLVFAG